jgi:thymidylate kinase
MRDEAILEANRPGGWLGNLWDLVDGFNGEGIAYCYWKSSRRLAAVLAGESDLDLLVGRADQHRAQAILISRGFKLFPSHPARADCASVSYIGFDEPSGRITHVHLHMRLLAGLKLLPNYRLPWEARLLAKAPFHPLFSIRVLDPTDEAVLLVIRACVEFQRHDPVMVRHWRAVAEKFHLDRAELVRQVDRLDVRRRAAELVGADGVDSIVQSLYDELPLHRQRRRHRHIRTQLAPYRMYNSLEANLRSAVRATMAMAGSLNQRVLHAPRLWRRSAPGGGIVVALLGVDGSGKSTAVHAVQEWLKAEVDTMPIYFGTGDGRPSLVLLPFKLLVPAFSRICKSRPQGSSHGQVSKRAPGLHYTIALALWASMLAWEKRLKLKAARRGADRGLVVIADRYPQDQIVAFNDGPLLPRLSWIPKWLREFEARSYSLAGKLQPDLVFKLRASPALIAEREPTMDRAVIERRVSELDQLRFPGASIVCVDAAEPVAQVTRAIKREIWRLL